MFTVYSVLRSQAYTGAIVLDTEDTDNYVQAAYVARQITGHLCLKRKHQLINAQCVCNEEMTESIIPLHVLTGCDDNSGFYGTSKKVITGRVQTSKVARDLLASCGRELPAKQELIDDLELLVIRYIYCDVKNNTLAGVRAAKWRGLKKKSTMRLAPDSDSLRHHIERANYLAYFQKNFNLDIHPSPVGHGWHLVNGLCMPLRSSQLSLPSSMSLAATSHVEEDSNSSSDDSSASDDSESCDSSSDSED